MQYFNTWSIQPWSTSTDHPSPNPSLNMTHENQHFAEAENTKVMTDCNEKMDDTNFIQTRVSGTRSHIKANDLRNEPIVKIFLEDLLEEKLKGFQETSIDTKNTANVTWETAVALRQDFQDMKALLASSQREMQEAMATGQQEILNQVHSMKQEISQLKDSRKRTADQISGISEEDVRAFTAEIGKQKNHIDLIEKELDEKRKECVCIGDLHQEAINEIEQLKSTDQLFAAVDDDAVVSQWKELGFSIRNLTRQRLGGPYKWLPSSPQQERHFKIVSTDYQWFMEKSEYAALLFQGVIWHFLGANILEGPSRVWGNSLGNAIGRSMQDEFQQREEKYHVLRAHACTVLHENYEIDKRRIANLLQTLYNRINLFDTNRDRISFRSELTRIITKASELAVVIAQAKAQYVPSGLDLIQSHKQFSSSWMEVPCEKARNGPMIDLLITPALIK